jgi:hypothetical protein
MKSLYNIHKEGEERFNHVFTNGTFKEIKSHIKERELAMLRGVMEELYSVAKVETPNGGFIYVYQAQGEALKTFLQEQIKLIEEDGK